MAHKTFTLLEILKSPSGKLHTDDTLTLLLNQLSKHLTDRPISVVLSNAQLAEMVIFATAPIFK